MRTLSCLFGLWVLVVASSCGDDFESSDPPPSDPTCATPSATCEQTPWCCPAGQTCWVAADASAFLCHNAGTGVDGAECQNILGQPSCASGLGCFQTNLSEPGHCTPFCSQTNPDHACPAGRPCVQLMDGSTGALFYLCDPPA